MSKTNEAEMALEAMKRAAESARQRAARFHSHLVTWKDGRVVLVDASQAVAEQVAAANSIPSKVGKSDG